MTARRPRCGRRLSVSSSTNSICLTLNRRSTTPSKTKPNSSRDQLPWDNNYPYPGYAQIRIARETPLCDKVLASDGLTTYICQFCIGAGAAITWARVPDGVCRRFTNTCIPKGYKGDQTYKPRPPT